MTLPASGQISFSQLACELGNACSNIDLRSYSACANLTTPDSINELYNCRCIPIYGTAVWSSATSTITTRSAGGGAGARNSGLIAGGYTNTTTTCTEEYNGSTWSTSNALSGVSRRYNVGLGTQNSALSSDGQGSNGFAISSTEEYDGSTWSASNSSIVAVFTAMGSGTQNSAVTGGGGTSNTASSNRLCTEEYNGTSWSSGNSIIQCRRSGASGVNGTQNSALIFGGIFNFPTGLTNTEEYDGTTWATGGNLNNGRAGQTGGGTQNSALHSHGYSTGFCFFNNAEEYNGTTWSNVSSAINCIIEVSYFGDTTATYTVFCTSAEEYIQPIIAKCLG